MQSRIEILTVGASELDIEDFIPETVISRNSEPLFTHKLCFD